MLIKLDGVTKYYYSASSVSMALHKIKLEFKMGEFVAITGESGSGKSTLLNVISGMTTYDDGELYIEEEETSSYDAHDWEVYRRDRIGFVYQNYNLIDKFTVYDNVESALIIRGCGKQNRHKETMDIIREVGLEKQIHQKAGKLSSGQKQRLAIARAIAKETDIIVADEPTGNLDSENGKQIVELFQKLAKEKLIIMVTHNLEQALPYVSRVVRLYDGEVVSDQTNQKVQEVPSRETNQILLTGAKKKLFTAWHFAGLNILRQPLRGMLFGFFILFAALVSYIFIGEIAANYDDVYTRKYDTSAFYQENEKRLIVTRLDGETIEAKDMAVFRDTPYVTMVDQYDVVNDMNYYIEEGVDYQYIYGSSEYLDSEEESDTTEYKSPEFLSNQKFMKSASCITQSDLSAGELPKSYDEIVLYSQDKSLIGTTKTCFIKGLNLWGEGVYLETTMTITGILEDSTSQVYFSDAFCGQFAANSLGEYVEFDGGWNELKKSFDFLGDFIPVIAEDLEENQVRVSRYLSVEENYQGNAYFSPGAPLYYFNSGTSVIKNRFTSDLVLTSLTDTSSLNVAFIEVSENAYNTLFSKGSNQASVYIKDYIYTDAVMKDLSKEGYSVISTFRAASTEYDTKLVYNRITILLISFGGLIIMAVLNILIVSSLLKIKRKDYNILRSMGMGPKTVRLINIFELNIYAVSSILLVISGSGVLVVLGIGDLEELVKYMGWKNLGIFVLYNLAITQATAFLFNRYLERRMDWRRKI